MAKFLSPVYTDVRGSIGGLNYCPSFGAGMVARARVTGDKSHSNNRTSHKSAVSWAVARWNVLHDGFQDGWKRYASSVIYSGSMGPYICSGRTVFVSTFSFLHYYNTRGLQFAGLDPAPPVKTGGLKLSNLGFHNNGLAPGRLYLDFGNPNEEAIRLYITRSNPKPLTVNVSQGDLDSDSTIMTYVAPLDTSTTKLITGLQPGAVYFFRIRAASDRAPFRLSPKFWIRAIAA